MIVKINVSLRNTEREVISCDDAGGVNFCESIMSCHVRSCQNILISAGGSCKKNQRPENPSGGTQFK